MRIDTATVLNSDDISEDTYMFLMSQKKEDIISILVQAIDNMQSYNGRSIESVIREAIRDLVHDKE